MNRSKRLLNKRKAFSIFLKWHLPRFTWTGIASVRISDIPSLKDLVDECLEVENLKLVSLAFRIRVTDFFQSYWGVRSWKELSCLDYFKKYDFTGLPVEYQTKRTVVREFLFSWLGSCGFRSRVPLARNFGFIQFRPDLAHIGVKYDVYHAEELCVSQTEYISQGGFEYVANCCPNVKGCLNNSYDVSMRGKLIEKFSAGARNWTRCPGASEKIHLKVFIALMNYPRNDSHGFGYEDRALFTFPLPEFNFRYLYGNESYKPFVRKAVHVFLCIWTFSENSPIWLLPREIVFMIVDLVRKTDMPYVKASWCNAPVVSENINLDPWRILLHRE